jgi:NADH-quinone oxidoreductase subunit L
LWGIAAITALLTAIYMTRMMVMTFWGTERFLEKPVTTEHSQPGDDEDHHAPHGIHEPHESPWVMTVPLIVLAVLSTVGGFMGVSYALGSLVTSHPVNYIERVLEPVISEVPASRVPETTSEAAPAEHAEAAASEHATEATHSPEEIRSERLLALISVLIAATGLGIGWMIFTKRPLLRMPKLLEDKYYVDEIYDATIIKPIKVGSREGLWKIFDIGVIDGFLHSLADVVKEAGRAFRYLQAGFVRGYAAIILIGALAVIAFFAWFGIQALGYVR